MSLFSLSAFFSALFIIILCLVLLLNFVGLPANWIILGLLFLWDLFFPGMEIHLWQWLLLLAFAIAGEILEFFMKATKAKCYGSSSAGTWGAMGGAFFGALLLSPLFAGLGAIPGALGGAYAGCFLVEYLRGENLATARRSAYGALIGCLLGSVCKIGIGVLIIVIAYHAIWPKMS